MLTLTGHGWVLTLWWLAAGLAALLYVSCWNMVYAEPASTLVDSEPSIVVDIQMEQEGFPKSLMVEMYRPSTQEFELWYVFPLTRPIGKQLLFKSRHPFWYRFYPCGTRLSIITAATSEWQIWHLHAFESIRVGSWKLHFAKTFRRIRLIQRCWFVLTTHEVWLATNCGLWLIHMNPENGVCRAQTYPLPLHGLPSEICTTWALMNQTLLFLTRFECIQRHSWEALHSPITCLRASRQLQYVALLYHAHEQVRVSLWQSHVGQWQNIYDRDVAWGVGVVLDVDDSGDVVVVVGTQFILLSRPTTITPHVSSPTRQRRSKERESWWRKRWNWLQAYRPPALPETNIRFLPSVGLGMNFQQEEDEEN